jgi:hypothetical protein
LLNPPEIVESSKLADWAELCLMFGNDASISKSEFITAFEEDMKQDVESTITIIWHEVYWRKMIASDYYPFEISASNIERKSDWEETICYCFMTLLSAQSFIPEIKVKPAEWTATAKLFEKVTESALKKYVGETIIMGAPRTDNVPTNFDDSITYLCERIREDRGKILVARSKRKMTG